jgi:hypothetical protein
MKTTKKVRPNEDRRRIEDLNKSHPECEDDPVFWLQRGIDSAILGHSEDDLETCNRLYLALDILKSAQPATIPAEHTATPWVMQFDGPTEHARPHLIISADRKQWGQPIASTFRGRAEHRANAEFIVRACNSHEELCAALAELVKAEDVKMGRRAVKLRIEIARNALARAERGGSR